MTSSPYQQGSLTHNNSEVVSNCVSAILLIIAAMVLLIQVLNIVQYWQLLYLFQMSIHGKYFVNHYEAKVFAGVLALVNGVLYLGASVCIHKSMQHNT